MNALSFLLLLTVIVVIAAFDCYYHFITIIMFLGIVRFSSSIAVGSFRFLASGDGILNSVLFSHCLLPVVAQP
jgi:hypothetical protein